MSDKLTRLRWQCRRGMLELDLFLMTFLEHGYDSLDETERQTFEVLLKMEDQLLFEYLMKQKEPEEGRLIELIDKIRHTTRTHA